MTHVLLALGANQKSRWGQPEQTFHHVVKELDAQHTKFLQLSALYRTSPLGNGLQRKYYNAALCITTELPPNTLFRKIKMLESDAGRRLGQHWGSRALDIDILDYPGYRIGWPPPELRRSLGTPLRATGRRPRGRLILPHPQLHLRAFVLYPLMDIARHWRHPILGLSLKTLIERLANSQRPSDLPAIAPLRATERLAWGPGRYLSGDSVSV